MNKFFLIFFLVAFCLIPANSSAEVLCQKKRIRVVGKTARPIIKTFPESCPRNFRQLLDLSTLSTQGGIGPQGIPGPQGNVGPQGPAGFINFNSCYNKASNPDNGAAMCDNPEQEFMLHYSFVSLAFLRVTDVFISYSETTEGAPVPVGVRVFGVSNSGSTGNLTSTAYCCSRN